MNIQLTVYFILIVISVFTTSYFFRLYKLASESSNWPHTSGRIKSIKRSSSGSSNETTTWFCSITYVYAVGDREYTSSRINFRNIVSQADMTLVEAVDLEKRFKVDAEVNVYYKESDPRLSVLEPGSSRELKYALVASIFFVLIFICGAFTVF